jgi:hypothetical protein
LNFSEEAAHCFGPPPLHYKASDFRYNTACRLVYENLLEKEEILTYETDSKEIGITSKSAIHILP